MGEDKDYVLAEKDKDQIINLMNNDYIIMEDIIQYCGGNAVKGKAKAIETFITII